MAWLLARSRHNTCGIRLPGTTRVLLVGRAGGGPARGRASDKQDGHAGQDAGQDHELGG